MKVVPAQSNSTVPALKARVNHVAAAEAQDAPDVILGTFLLTQFLQQYFSILVLHIHFYL